MALPPIDHVPGPRISEFVIPMEEPMTVSRVSGDLDEAIDLSLGVKRIILRDQAHTELFVDGTGGVFDRELTLVGAISFSEDGTKLFDGGEYDVYDG